MVAQQMKTSTLDEAALTDLRSQVRGGIVCPGDEGYDAARAVYNAMINRRPAVIVRDPRTPSRAPSYFILLEWMGDRVVNIRDFRFARYATEGAELFVME